MTVSFEDGTSATANLVIGADGIHSAVRSHYVVCIISDLAYDLLTGTARYCPIWRNGRLSRTV